MTSKSSPDGSVTQNGDLVRLEFDLWAEAGGRTELLDSTHEEVAQSSGAPVPAGRTWGPRPHQIGGEFFPRGIENALVGVKLGEKVDREFAPGDAFGERDANLIELFSMHEVERLPEMRRKDAHLDLGTVLTINGRRGRVTTLTAARVRVDFNPPFAGRKVRGTFTVVDKISQPAEQARAIVELQYGHGADFSVEFKDSVLTVKVPDRAKFDPGWIVAKARVIDRVRAQLAPEVVRFVEEFVTPKAEKKAAPSAKEPAGDAPHEAPEASEHPAKHLPAKRSSHPADEASGGAVEKKRTKAAGETDA